jgi:uncharacterized membrane protein YedE/YeeE
MENFTPYTAILGGLLIGLSATMLMSFNGRIAGISGIFYGAFEGKKHDTAWRWWFVAGLLGAAAAFFWIAPASYTPISQLSLKHVAFAGLLVGFGTRLGSGCTSGHGVCGIARFSMRSIIATATFMFTGFATTYVVRHLLGAGS